MCGINGVEKTAYVLGNELDFSSLLALVNEICWAYRNGTRLSNSVFSWYLNDNWQ